MLAQEIEVPQVDNQHSGNIRDQRDTKGSILENKPNGASQCGGVPCVSPLTSLKQVANKNCLTLGLSGRNQLVNIREYKGYMGTYFNRGPFGGHHLGGDVCSPTTFLRGLSIKIHNHIQGI